MHAPVTLTEQMPPPLTAPAPRDVNDVPLARELLTQALSVRSLREALPLLLRQVSLVVDGGAVMVIRPSFSHRESKEGVD
jgi:hypothetical protein